MGGSISDRFLKSRGYYVVDFYVPELGRNRTFLWYRGLRMETPNMASKLLSTMQSEVERGVFRWQRYAGKGSWTDVNPEFEKWLETKKKKKPATYKGYRSYFKNWIKPFFEVRSVMLHEISLSILDELLDSIKLSGKGKHNVMMAFHAFMDYLWRDGKIEQVPPFPEKADYGIVEPTIKWLPEARQMAIINAIPEVHRPIFLWLKYHYRRPAEACALKWEDWDAINKVFTVRRSISSRRIVDSTKTGAEHTIPCHPRFIPVIKRFKQEVGQFIFINPMARKPGSRYTNESLNNHWRNACCAVGESIDLYSGLKHSSCSQWVNEIKGSIEELQILTDHKRTESVKRYAKTGLARKRELMGRVIPMERERKAE